MLKWLLLPCPLRHSISSSVSDFAVSCPPPCPLCACPNNIRHVVCKPSLSKLTENYCPFKATEKLEEALQNQKLQTYLNYLIFEVIHSEQYSSQRFITTFLNSLQFTIRHTIQPLYFKNLFKIMPADIDVIIVCTVRVKLVVVLLSQEASEDRPAWSCAAGLLAQKLCFSFSSDSYC